MTGHGKVKALEEKIQIEKILPLYCLCGNDKFESLGSITKLLPNLIVVQCLLCSKKYSVAILPTSKEEESNQSKVRCCDCALFDRCHQALTEEFRTDLINCIAFESKSENQSLAPQEEK